MVLRVVTNKISKIISYVSTMYGATGEVSGSEIMFDFDEDLCQEVANDVERRFNVKVECL
jgi:CheY-specific phosphatase CheX